MPYCVIKIVEVSLTFQNSPSHIVEVVLNIKTDLDIRKTCVAMIGQYKVIENKKKSMRICITSLSMISKVVTEIGTIMM
jgi:hypothetical protein